MADISKITLPNGNTYDIKDEVARSAAGAGLQIEVVTTLPTASSSTMGKIYLKAHDPDGTNNYYDEYVTVRTGSSTYTYSWELLGTTEVDLSNYSVKTHTHQVTSNVSVGNHTYTPVGFVSSISTFEGDNIPISLSGSPSGSITVIEHSSGGGANGNYTPTGSMTGISWIGSNSTFTGSFTPSGKIWVGDTYNPLQRPNTINVGTAAVPVEMYSSSSTYHDVAYTPTGTNSSSIVSFGSHTTATVPTTAAFGTKSVAKVTANGSAGSAASCTLPAFTATVSNETLILGWSAGSFTANTPTTLPTFGTETVATYDSTKTASPITAIGTATAAAQTFTGTTVYPGTHSKSRYIDFDGTSGSVSVSGTPLGSISSQGEFVGGDVTFGFTGNNMILSGTVEPTGTVDTSSTFTGTLATITHSVTNGTVTSSQASA